MNSRIDMEKVDYSDHADILKELYSGGRQLIEAKWEDFLQIPLTKGYEANIGREVDFNDLKDLSGNSITVTIVEDGVPQSSNIQ
jgi:hypothetical protein